MLNTSRQWNMVTITSTKLRISTRKPWNLPNNGKSIYLLLNRLRFTETRSAVTELLNSSCTSTETLSRHSYMKSFRMPTSKELKTLIMSRLLRLFLRRLDWTTRKSWLSSMMRKPSQPRMRLLSSVSTMKKTMLYPVSLTLLSMKTRS